MKKILLNNWALKIASLLLAFVLWFLIVQISDPKESKPFANIPVKLVNTELLDRQNKVYEVLDNTDTVRVTVRAPRSVIDRLRAGDIVAEADVSKLTDINTIAIRYEILNVDGVDSVEGNHDFVQLNVEDRRNRWISVVSSTSGEVAEGYMVSNVVLDQTSIEVSGPKSVVERIDHASVVMDVSAATTDLSANVEIELYDNEGGLMEWGNVTTNVNHVHMSVEVLAVKTVPVEIDYTGTPGEGYVVTGNVDFEPKEVAVAGKSAVLDGISKIVVPEGRISVDGAVSDVVETINLKEYLPENTRLAESSFNGRVQVTVPIEAIEEKTLELQQENIFITNKPEDVTIEIVADTVMPQTVKVSGLNELIAPLRSNTLRGMVDIGAWMREQQKESLESGVYTVPVKLELDDKINQVNDITIHVVVTANSAQ